MRSAGQNPAEIEPEAVEEADRILEAAAIEPEPPEEDMGPTREPGAPGPGAAAAEAEAKRILAAAKKADVLGPIVATEA